MKKIIVLAALATLLSACKVDIPEIESGVTRDGWVRFDTPDRVELSQRQIDAFTTWFRNHRDGWKHEITDTPAKRMILFRHKDGRVTSVLLQASKVWVGNRYRDLSEEEHADLQAILDAKFLLPSEIKK
jgi:hypothetical protein